MTMNHPTAPCSPPRTNSETRRGPKPFGMARLKPNQATPTKKTRPRMRPRSRWTHSQKKMNLKPDRVMPAGAATSRYCGVCRYRSNACCQSAWVNGGIAPLIGFHSVIERPLSVRRVMPPTTTIAKTRHAVRSNSRESAREGGKGVAFIRSPPNRGDFRDGQAGTQRAFASCMKRAIMPGVITGELSHGQISLFRAAGGFQRAGTVGSCGNCHSAARRYRSRAPGAAQIDHLHHHAAAALGAFDAVLSLSQRRA